MVVVEVDDVAEGIRRRLDRLVSRIPPNQAKQVVRLGRYRIKENRFFNSTAYANDHLYLHYLRSEALIVSVWISNTVWPDLAKFN